MSNASSNQQRLLELLADQAIEGITVAELNELRNLLANSTLDPLTMELVAARIAVAFPTNQAEPLPNALQDRIRLAAKRLPQFGGLDSSKISSAADLPTPVAQPFAKKSKKERFAWLIAAACLLALIATWSYQWFKPEITPVSLAARLESASDKVQIPWTGTDDSAARGARGEIVWSNSLQAGYLKATGLAKNDANANQYQLWIFDTAQDDRYPIDGGVFNIDSDGTAIIPMTAKLHVVDPAMFAVTVEKPGGVVVSARERVVLLVKRP